MSDQKMSIKKQYFFVRYYRKANYGDPDTIVKEEVPVNFTVDKEILKDCWLYEIILIITENKEKIKNKNKSSSVITRKKITNMLIND